MVAFISPGFWKQKPTVLVEPARGHPLANDIIGAWLMFEGAGNSVHDVTRRNDGLIEGSGIDWMPDYQEGMSLSFQGSAVADRVSLGSITAGNELNLARFDSTIIARVLSDHSAAASNLRPRIIEKSSQTTGETGANGYTFYPDLGTSSGERLEHNFDAFSRNSTAGDLLVTDIQDEWITLAANRHSIDGDASPNGTFEFFSDHPVALSSISAGGPLRSLGTDAVTNNRISNNTTTTTASIGQRGNATSATEHWSGQMSWVMVFGRKLDIGELQHISSEPYAMFGPRLNRSYFFVSGTTGQIKPLITTVAPPSVVVAAG